jgi:hypothetical protein
MTKRFALTTENGKLTCPELAGYELPEWEGQKDADMEKKVRDIFPPKNSHLDRLDEVDGNAYYRSIWRDGYRKSREKFEFTERDLRKAYDTNHYSKEDKDNQWGNFIASLRTARTPIAIEVEMERVWNGDCFDIPATNPDGTVKGRWVYE